ncbi:hypothetical protein BGZ99_009431 [Dissophora globulifera]|uniref:Uncharacterized protein n=1 Tax=Dissophora globulifera TaxID=979702 RepID=A0A9P6RX94_9FUNG|nr:hypothetical protein BGZ99_009431 [Dissophora globulifera]
MGAGCCKEEAIDFNGEIELSHFHLLRSVGKGAFGKVRVVQHKYTKEIYALKYINKAKCIRMRAVENIIQERRVLEEVAFPLICNLRYSFQDDENLFMVLDLMLGGDLRFHLERAGPMREDVVRFYVAELALALDALHARNIIHRDLKPDNVLLDEHGHAHLSDFNIAVYYSPSKPLMSIAGSMAYMAPEVLLRKGYYASVDWWSLGVVMFELLFGKRPFRGKSNELLTNSIIRDPLPFPENSRNTVSAQCMDVLSKLCERNVSKRLGCTSEGINGFKKHPWFQGIDWEKLVTKEAIPPFEPDSKRANFDATHELEELLMEDNPLKAKKRAQMSPETELSTEMQMMEDKFTVYDFTKVKGSHSLSRGRVLRPTNDPKMNSGTLDGAVTRSSSSRPQHMQMTAPPMIFRPDSPSDRIGQDRFNPDDDHISLTNPGYRNSPLSSPALTATTKSSSNSEHYRYNNRSDVEKAGYFELQQPKPKLPESKNLAELMQTDAIVLPPTSLPRPLQPRDNTTGHRTGSPRHHPSPYVPSSPLASPTPSYGSPTLRSSGSPAIRPSGSPAIRPSGSPALRPSGSPALRPSGQQEADQFSLPDSGMPPPSIVGNGNSAGNPLQNFNTPPPVARRAVRGRESSSHVITSMPAAVSQASPRLQANTNTNAAGSSGRRQPDVSGGNQQPQYQLQQQTRPVSEYMAGKDDMPLNVRSATGSSTRGDDRKLYSQHQHEQ